MKIISEKENQRKRLEIIRVKKWQKETNYKSEKTPKQRKIRYIKRKTRYHFPLFGNYCNICEDEAEVRHHTTKPIKYDKFDFLFPASFFFTVGFSSGLSSNSSSSNPILFIPPFHIFL